jgi:dinuclear metal center YbgI/SA1388 family protein
VTLKTETWYDPIHPVASRSNRKTKSKNSNFREGENMAVTVQDILGLIDAHAPWEDAESWDNVGLLFGSPSSRVSKILCALEVTGPVINEAIKKNADIVLVHHPLIFRPVNKIDTDRYPGNLLAKLIRKDIALVAAHTNLDKSPCGTNYALADTLGVESVRYLFPEIPASKQVKFVVFVPDGYQEVIIDAIVRGGGAVIGKYSHCTFRSPGTGTFKPLKGANPFIGKQGSIEEVAEYRMESVVPRRAVGRVVTEVLKAHPYEEPAYDIYPLEETFPKGGFGCVGTLKRAVTMRTLISRIKEILKPRTVQAVGKMSEKMQSVAISTGAGDSVIPRIRPGTADVIIVGEINHHTALAAKADGINIITAGHYETEILGIRRLGEILASSPLINKNKVSIIHSNSQSSPFANLK